jgi:hypothetical protein
MHVPLGITTQRFVSPVTSMLKMLRPQANQMDISGDVIWLMKY